MLSKKIEKALNEQINAELYSSYLYLAMSSYLSSVNLNGFATWMRLQAQEELTHAMKFYDYVVERGGRVILEAIDKPQAEWKDVVEIFEAALEHEKYITGRINDLMTLAMDEKDHATASFLQWFVDEQVEEEASVDEILQQLKMIDGKGPGLFMLDREARQRSAQAENE